MTNAEYLRASLSDFGLRDETLELILLKSGLSATEEAKPQACDLATYDHLSLVLGASLRNVTEGGYSISWNVEALKLYYRALCSSLGKPNLIEDKPRVRNRSNMW